MTTALPSRAYVWGRYLMGLLISLSLAILVLLAILGMGLLLHLTIASYPAPVVGTVLLLWVSMVLPATIVVSSLSFALGTMFPRQSTLVKIGVLLVWFIAALVIPPSGGGPNNPAPPPPAWYMAWDPTSAATAQGMLRGYAMTPQASQSQFQHLLLSVENSLPSISAWLGPHLILAGLSLLLVVAAAFTFQRFRGAVGSAS
jgi:ABC-type transport system involved in multi-copper enzyme maturation permease subunit